MNDKIRVVHVAQANGGVECYLKTFLNKVDFNKYEHYLILSKQYIKSKELFERMGAKVYIVDMPREMSVKSDLKAMFNIWKILKELKPNIVYSHSSKAGGVARIPAKLVGAINIYNPHGWAFDMNISSKKKIVYVIIEKILAIVTNKIIAISEYEQKVALEKNITKSSKIKLIENAIEIEKFNVGENSERLLNKLNWSSEDVIFGTVARISEQKSPKTFIEIAEKISKKVPNSKFLMVGDGDLRAEIESLINEKNMQDKFYITGWVENSNEYIELFDFALLTSKWEGFGLVIPEYMVSKKVVLASNVGGISNIIRNEETGYLIKDLDVDVFVEKILLLINDNNLKSKIISNAYNEAVKRFDSNRLVKEHEMIFENLCRSKKIFYEKEGME